jgi:hypothetical protein
MSDLISRKAVLDILKHSGVWHDRIEAIESIPSAESEIIRCKDCKHYNAGFECLIEGYGIERNKDWYCADAERREDG